MKCPPLAAVCVVFVAGGWREREIAKVFVDRVMRLSADGTHIFAAVVGARKAQIQQLHDFLARNSPVTVVELPGWVQELTPSISGRVPSLQHTAAIDFLADHVARLETFPYICLLDSDCFPIVAQWDRLASELMVAEGICVLTVIREERFNQDPDGEVPWAGFAMIQARKWVVGVSSIDALRVSPESLDRPLRQGEGLLAVGDCRQVFALKLSNHWTPAFKQFSIYGGAVLHIGAGSHPPRFGHTLGGPQKEWGLSSSSWRWAPARLRSVARRSRSALRRPLVLMLIPVRSAIRDLGLLLFANNPAFLLRLLQPNLSETGLASEVVFHPRRRLTR